MKATNNLIALVLVFMMASFSHAQDQGFMYGKVTTIDGKSYEGPIRWGKEETYWTDMFNASKDENENLDYLSRDDIRDLEDQYYRKNRNWGDRWGEWFSGDRFNIRWGDDDFQHQFVCQFGEIKSIKPTGRERADVELQNGKVMDVDGSGYNDIATKVRVLDSEIGMIELSWSRIEEVEFMNTPSKLDEKFGEPLFGTVETYGGTFTGYVQWDHDERVDTDVLDGDTDDGDVSIAFSKIKSIEREGFRSAVVLNSGREMQLSGSNDVNSGNRGIIVTNNELGRVDIPWREFKKVTFDSPKEKMKSYADFKNQTELTATVKTRKGETLKGKVVYDLDEAFEYEVLQGKSDEIEYIIPFRNIGKIIPKNYDNSTVVLVNGESILLGDAQDVSDRNTGLLVFQGNDRPVYVLWEDVDEIAFD